MKRMFHQNKLNPGEGGTIAEFSWNCIVPLKFVKKDYVDHLGQMKCVRKSEELKAKGRKRRVGTRLQRHLMRAIVKF